MQRIDQCAHLKYRGSYIRAVLALSQGRHKLIPIAAFIEETVAETQKVLKRLVEDGLVAKNGTLYHIPDHLFRFWLREVFQKRHDLFLPEERMLRKHLFDELGRVLDLCARMTEEDVGPRMEALLKEFRNDGVELCEEKMVCPQFSEVVLLKHLPHAVLSFLGRGLKGRWIFYLSLDWIGESEIERVVADANVFTKSRGRFYRSWGDRPERQADSPRSQNANLGPSYLERVVGSVRFSKDYFAIEPRNP
jgi:hypothetical protein